MIKQQRGISTSALLAWCIVIVFVIITGMKLVPSLIEYQSVLKTVKNIAAGANDQSTVSDLRGSFTKHAQLNRFSSVKADDLEITKEGGKVVISFSYEERIPLSDSVSVVIDYHGSSK